MALLQSLATNCRKSSKVFQSPRKIRQLQPRSSMSLSISLIYLQTSLISQYLVDLPPDLVDLSVSR